MLQNNKITAYLHKTKPAAFILFCSSAAFLTYCSMYAFRKPFTAGTYKGLELLGVDYKVALIILQLIGYVISKFIGIKFIAELEPKKRVITLIVLMGIALLSLLAFGLVPYPYNAVFMLINGLPLGLIWGVVFSFLEGRKFTEILGAFMASSFMIASGIVKSVGLFVMQQFNIAETWMPFFAAVAFIPILIIGIWMLSCIPEPNQEDKSLRTERVPMDADNRKRFFKLFWPGIFLVVAVYVGLTIFRDLRDNFAVELWTELGYLKTPWVLVFAEIPTAILVLVVIGSMILLKNNKKAFYLSLTLCVIAGIGFLISTYLFNEKLISPVIWMVLMGLLMYLPYLIFHTILFERWIAFFKYKGNLGYLMYMSDSLGYFGSMLVLLYKNYGTKGFNWLPFFTNTAWIIGVLITILGVLAIVYFRSKETPSKA
ncbi:MAG: DUF5690 family protein [Bacteroidetes bacterium]|nr:DUF5690 family protein [Bacteroidota bacterium]